MIEINLLPGARKKSRSSGSSSVDFRAMLAALGARFKDPWLGVAAGGALIGLGAVAAMFVLQSRTAKALQAQELTALQDSTRYDNVVRQTRLAAAQRDSIVRQMAIIAALDGERFVWPHIMDEVSRALPTYTWLRSVAFSSAPSAVSPEAVASGEAPRLGIRVIGYTVDVQALTIFMKQLEASPFLANVTLVVSELANLEGKQVTEFTLEVTYSKPDKSVIRTVPLSIAVR